MANKGQWKRQFWCDKAKKKVSVAFWSKPQTQNVKMNVNNDKIRNMVAKNNHSVLKILWCFGACQNLHTSHKKDGLLEDL